MSDRPTLPLFDPQAIPLLGTAFIEASAGTGKTHALASLYLRLIAERDLSPAEILVVTFTNAATSELRERIRNRIRDALAAVPDGASGAGREGASDPGSDGERAARLRRALRDFDQAAIFTIHGFCQRTLQEQAFECGLAFEAELVEKPERLQRTLVHDLATTLLADEDDDFREWLVAGAGSRWQFEPDELYRFMVGLLGADETMPVLPERAAAEAAAEGDTKARVEAADRAWQRFAACWRARWDEVEALLVDEGTPLNRNKYKPATIRSRWRSELELACTRAEEAPSPGLRACIEPPECVAKYLTTKQIRANTTGRDKKQGTGPSDPLFDLASELASAAAELDRAFDARAVALRRRFVDAVREAGRRRRDEQHVLFFDDLLAQLRAALRAPGSAALVEALRARYRFALIDEFQDTDAVQYEIFRTVWHGASVAAAGGGLFLIGDPKQAIYAFRGADLRTYLAARADAADRIQSLAENHRSDPAMVAAVNALFGATPNPFSEAAIGFQPLTSAEHPERPDYRAPARFAAGLRVSFLARDVVVETGTPLYHGAIPQRFGRTRWMAAMARDVAELLESGATIGDRPIAPSDIAILARRKRELDAARRALEALGIPCVSRSEGNVFDSREAWELASVLAAWLHPGDPRRLRAALSTGAHGLDAGALRLFGDDSAPLAALAERFADYGRLWSQHGFGRAFATWRAREEVDARLVAWADGDRRLANWLHLAELLARVEAERTASRTGLAAWLERAIADDGVREELGGEASLLRLERDDQAVQLVTLHFSKGLEYEVVYLPALWESFEARGARSGEADETKKRPPVRFHDAARGRRTLDLGADLADWNAHRALAQAEAAAEHLRLLYVGLTRAKRHCVVLWGCAGDDYAKSPLARLVVGGRAAAESIEEGALASFAKGLADDDWLEAWRSIEKSAADGAIRIESSDLTSRLRWRAAAAPVELARPDPPRALVLRPVTTTSFSALVRGAARGGIGMEAVAGARVAMAGTGPLATGRDLDAEVDGPSGGLDDAAPAAADLAADMHLFPRGTEAGTLLHEVLERADLTVCDEDAIRRLAGDWLARSPLGAGAVRVEQIVHVVRSVARTPLRAAPAPLRLGDLPRRQILPELEFTLAAPGDPHGRGFSPEALARILSDAEPGTPLARYAERAALLSWPVLTGFLRGFIDAVFYDGERYFVVDYKSNHLGNRQRDYLPERLLEPMIEHDYVLQSLLYTVALDRHLASRLAGYDPERHLGGAYYLFLRGLAECHPEGCGIFFDRPGAAIVRRISELLGAAGGEGR